MQIAAFFSCIIADALYHVRGVTVWECSLVIAVDEKFGSRYRAVTENTATFG